MATKELSNDEVIERCPFCPNYIITLKSNTMNFFFCKKTTCSKVSCTVCNKQLPTLPEDYDKKEEEKDNVATCEKHFECWELKEFKEKFDKVLNEGSKQFCPKCGLGGRKDDASTHMTCPAC